MKIWLDDIRPAPEGWLWAKTVRELAHCLAENPGRITAISFDHDLGENEQTGYDALKTFEQFAGNGWWAVVPDTLLIHSANPVGRKNMQAAIDSIERMRANGL